MHTLALVGADEWVDGRVTVDTRFVFDMDHRGMFYEQFATFQIGKERGYGICEYAYGIVHRPEGWKPSPDVSYDTLREQQEKVSTLICIIPLTHSFSLRSPLSSLSSLATSCLFPGIYFLVGP